MNRIREKHQRFRILVRHQFLETAHKRGLLRRIGLSGNMLGLLVDKPQIVKQGVHAAGRILNAVSEKDVGDDRVGGDEEMGVKEFGELLSLFGGQRGGAPGVAVVEKAVFLSVAKAGHPIPYGLFIEKHDGGDVGDGSSLIQEEQCVCASMFDGGPPGAVKDTPEGGALLIGEESAKLFHVLRILHLRPQCQLFPKYQA